MENKHHKIAVTFGRFNLLHKGHIMLFEKMAECADEIIIGLSNNDKNLRVADRKEVIELALAPTGINFKVIDASNPFELFEVVKGKESLSVAAFFGEDQNTLSLAAHRAYGWTPKVIERMTSSTVVRALIDNEEWDLLGKIVPSRITSKVIKLRKAELSKTN